MLVTPTTAGNLLVGPNAEDIADKEGTDTTAEGLAEVAEKSSVAVRDVPLREVITSFSGLRAHQPGHDFVIGEVPDAPGFVDCAAIESPGLSACPAIGRMGSGASYGEMYSLAICFFMEMQWINSNCIHSGEYFHGPFEVTDYDIPFVITLGNGCTRHLDERALAFARKYSKRLFVIDENDFDLSAVDESLREYFAPIVETAVVRYMIDALAHAWIPV